MLNDHDATWIYRESAIIPAHDNEDSDLSSKTLPRMNAVVFTYGRLPRRWQYPHTFQPLRGNATPSPPSLDAIASKSAWV